MNKRRASQDLTRITLAVVFIGLMIVASLWILRPFAELPSCANQPRHKFRHDPRTPYMPWISRCAQAPSATLLGAARGVSCGGQEAPDEASRCLLRKCD